MTYRHGFGDDVDGCLACYDAEPRDPLFWCHDPEPDPEDPGFCRWCYHTVEEVDEPSAA